MSDVFISYKSDDYPAANRFRISLLENGISCWMAPESIVSGSSYAVEIPRAISESRVFLLLMTEKALDSKWIPKEIDRAINCGVLIFPIILEQITLRNGYDFMLSDIQCYYAQSTLDLTIATTVGQIKNILKQSGTVTPKEDADEKVRREKEAREQEEAAKKRIEQELAQALGKETDRRYKELVDEAKGIVTDQRFKELVEKTKKEVSEQPEGDGEYICGFEYKPTKKAGLVVTGVFAFICLILTVLMMTPKTGYLSIIFFVVFFVMLMTNIMMRVKNIFNLPSSYMLYERRFKGYGVIGDSNNCSSEPFDVAIKEVEKFYTGAVWGKYQSISFTARGVRYRLMCANGGSADWLAAKIESLQKQ